MADNNLSLAERVAEVFKERADAAAHAVAEKLGVPTDRTSVSEAQEIEMWTFSPHADPQAVATELLMQNMPPDQIVDQVYPWRSKMVKHSRPDPKQQVQYAERMKKLSAGYTESNPA